MADEIVVADPQKSPQAPEEVVSLSKKELEDLKHKAEVSSQNFERLKAEEQKRKELEARLEELQINPVLSESGDEAVDQLKKELAEVKQKQAKGEVLDAHPYLKEVWSEFESFRDNPENKGMNMRTAAKAFSLEKGLLEPKRQGLERGTGGDRAPIATGMSTEDVKKLRETNYRQYREMLKKGQIKF